MRVGKRANVVEAKRTRSCVVRLENISSPPMKFNKAVGRVHSQSHGDDKTYKGPLKKRPTTQNVTPNTSQTRTKPVGTPNPAHSAKSKFSTPSATQTSSKSGTPNSAQSAKSKSATPNSAQSAKSKFDSPNVAQTSSKAGASKSMQASTSKTKYSAKDSFKTPLKAGKSELTKPPVTPAPTEPTPTIAAGRSRRAIKPNPKYASEDIVTPKMIRNVATMSGTGGTAAKKSTSTKKRKASTSSLDDFFSRDSDDEIGNDDLEDELDKMYRAIAKDSDSDFSDGSKVVTRPTKRKAQQRKSILPTSANTAATMPRPTAPTAHKGQPSQLQLLRKSFAAANRSSDPKGCLKRVRSDSVTAASSSDNDGDISGIARKRLLLTKPSSNVTGSRDNKNLNSSELTMHVRKTPHQTVNGSKISKLKSESGALIVEPKRNITRVIEKRTLMDGNSVAMKMVQQSRFQQTVRSNNNNNSLTTASKSTTSSTSTSATRTLITMPIKTQNARGLSLTKRRSASPAIIKPIPKPTRESKATNESNVENQTTESEERSKAVEDFETMPTFTIVNINDIINKKGDVLISKSDKSQTADDSDMSDDYDLPKMKKSVEPKLAAPERRKVMPATKKIIGDIRRSKSPMITAATKKLSTQKILNHTLTKKSSPTSNSNATANRNKLNSSTSPEKPAPRILNSVVAKKTQPVKPMIANFDDSENENTYQFSLDGDEDMDFDDDAAHDKTVAPDDNDDVANDDDDPDDSFHLGKNKLPTSTPYTAKKKTAPPTKENTQTAPNRQVTTTKNIEHRKTTPEKVVISRQGDKVIKKITCFETWYVIVPNEVKPSKSETPRNILDMPLIKLANITTDIKLPNGDWKGKVTLHELSPTMLAKTNLTLFTGDLKEYNIDESERARYQPSCVMFRRSVNDRIKSRLPYDRAVIFKNRTFFTNIEGKNVKLVGAPSTINSQKEVEILLQIIDSLTLQSTFVEPTNTMQ